VLKQELNLIQFASGEMAQTSTRPSEVVGRELLNTDTSRSIFDDFSQNLQRHTISPDSAGLIYRAEHPAFLDLG
jgi:hypothetical protein